MLYWATKFRSWTRKFPEKRPKMKRQLQVPARIHIERLFRLVLPAIGILLIGFAAIFSFLTYKVTHPEAIQEPIDPSYYVLPSLNVTIPASNGSEIPAWWIPGLKNAPVIILAPGYGMSRSDGLSLAAELHEIGFNILIYAQRGSNITPKRSSTLGLHETDDMLNAVRFVQSRPESSPSRLGVWGVDIGAFAALKAAASFSEIRAIALDSVYGSISEFLDYRISEDFGLEYRFVQYGCYQIFRLSQLFGGFPIDEPMSSQVLRDRAILFIKGDNRKSLGIKTADFYNRIQPQKEMISLRKSRIHMMDGEDLKNYDRQIASFFELNLQR
jgi:pimeloyl-ACP methyl ester carboxylesterase